MKKKIIIDSDPGFDDVVAIFMAYTHPDIELLGITTIFGNSTTHHTTNNALYLEDTFSLNCDVVKGAEQPLQKPAPPIFYELNGNQGLGNVELSDVTGNGLHESSADQYMIDMIKAYPNEITIVAIGPLTNLALALKKAPEIAGLVKEVVVMGGAFGINDHFGNITPFAEANIYHDPHAADIVFSTDWPVTILGLDVTEESLFSLEFFENLKVTGGVYGELIYNISHRYVGLYSDILKMNGCYVHDASAIAYLLDDSLFEKRTGPVKVITEGAAEGLTLQKFVKRPYANDQWATLPEQNVCISVKKNLVTELAKSSIESYSSLVNRKAKLAN